jgi:molybdate transport system substrate-binding protein
MILLMMLRSSLDKSLLELAGRSPRSLSLRCAVSALLYYQMLVWCCQGFDANGLKAVDCELLVAAASDLTDLERDLGALVPDCKTRFTFSSSGLLAQQIRHGAPYDVFLSANSQFINDLAKSGTIRNETVHVYAYGQLAVWSKAGFGWSTLSSPSVKRISIANPALAPYGKAAMEALKSDPTIWRAVEPKLVYGENVRQAFQFAATGNADVCLTSYSLVHNRGGQLVDPAKYSPIAQSAGVVARSRGNTEKANELLNRLLGPQGQKVVAAYGLLPAASGGKPARTLQPHP